MTDPPCSKLSRSDYSRFLPSGSSHWIYHDITIYLTCYLNKLLPCGKWFWRKWSLYGFPAINQLENWAGPVGVSWSTRKCQYHVKLGPGLNWSTSYQLFQNLAWAVFVRRVYLCVSRTLRNDHATECRRILKPLRITKCTLSPPPQKKAQTVSSLHQHDVISWSGQPLLCSTDCQQICKPGCNWLHIQLHSTSAHKTPAHKSIITTWDVYRFEFCLAFVYYYVYHYCY